MATYNVNTDLVNGDDLFLYVTSGNSVVAFATSCSLSVEGETIDTSNKMSCRWNSNLRGKNSYTISADALYTQKSGVTNFDALMKLMLGDDPVDWAIGPAVEWTGSCATNTYALDTSAIYYSGKAVITSLSLNGGNNEVASCSVSMAGSGEITQNNYV